MEWTNKVAVVTGASTGIGKATAALLRQFGCIVYNLDHKEPERADDFFIHCDVSKVESVRQSFNQVLGRHDRIDFLFANAGMHYVGTVEETSEEQFLKVLSVNVAGVFYSLQSVLPVMKKQGGGSIVIMGSDQAFIGKGRSSVYGLTKGAVSQLTKSTAIDYAPFNIRINCICPGTIDTPLLHRAVDQFSEKTGATKEEINIILEKAQPIQRIAQPEEIARTVAFLLSDESSFTTGALIPVDGGYTCQ